MASELASAAFGGLGAGAFPILFSCLANIVRSEATVSILSGSFSSLAISFVVL